MKEVHDEAKACLTIAADVMKHYHDRRKGQSVDYKLGNEVWLEGRHLTSLRPTKKFADKRYGPFKILEKIGSSSYKLDLPTTWRAVHPVFNEVLLTPYFPPAFPNQNRPPPPPPIDVEGHPEYEVDTIIRVRNRRGRKPRGQ